MLAKGFVCTVVLFEEYRNGGVGIPEGSDLLCSGSNRNILCCTRIRQRDECGGRQNVIDSRRESEVQESEGSTTEVGVN